MPDVQELSDNDMDVVERMKGLPDSVLFGEEVEDVKAGQERSDDPDAPDEIRDGAEASEQEAVAETEAKDKEGATTEDADPEFEVENPDGGEPERVKLSELLDAKRELTAFKAEKDAIFQREETRAREFITQRVTQVEQWSSQVAAQLNAAMQLVQAPRPPSIELRNPASPQYDPDRYETERYHYEQRKAQYDEAQGLAQRLTQQAEQLASARQEERESAELVKLNRVWPAFGKPEVMNTFVSEMGKAYGFSPKELDDVLVDHRQALVAKDALKWREHEAKQTTAKTTLKEKVVAAKPAKTGATQKSPTTLTTEQSQYMNARKALKANPKDMSAAAKGFMSFL